MRTTNGIRAIIGGISNSVFPLAGEIGRQGADSEVVRKTAAAVYDRRS